MTTTITSDADIDRQLFTRHLSGDDAAMVELFDRHNHRLYLYCLKLVGSSHAAEDLTQELWEKVVRLRVDGTDVHNPGGYFVRMARNLSLNHLRNRRRLTPLDDESLNRPSEGDPDSAQSELVEQALSRLTFEHREVLILNAYSGYNHEEIAVMLGKTPEAIWKRASRARKKLREVVLELMDEDLPSTTMASAPAHTESTDAS